MDVDNIFKKVMAALWPNDAQKSKIQPSDIAAFLIAGEMVLRGYNFAITKTGSACVAHFEAPPYVFGAKADTSGRSITLAAGKALGLWTEPQVETKAPEAQPAEPNKKTKVKRRG